MPHSDSLGSSLARSSPRRFVAWPRPSSAPDAKASTVCLCYNSSFYVPRIRSAYSVGGGFLPSPDSPTHTSTAHTPGCPGTRSRPRTLTIARSPGTKPLDSSDVFVASFVKVLLYPETQKTAEKTRKSSQLRRDSYASRGRVETPGHGCWGAHPPRVGPGERTLRPASSGGVFRTPIPVSRLSPGAAPLP